MGNTNPCNVVDNLVMEIRASRRFHLIMEHSINRYPCTYIANKKQFSVVFVDRNYRLRFAIQFYGLLRHKKDLGATAIAYGDVYTTSISLGADYNQSVKALKEAAEYPGTV